MKASYGQQERAVKDSQQEQLNERGGGLTGPGPGLDILIPENVSELSM